MSMIRILNSTKKHMWEKLIFKFSLPYLTAFPETISSPQCHLHTVCAAQLSRAHPSIYHPLKIHMETDSSLGSGSPLFLPQLEILKIVHTNTYRSTFMALSGSGSAGFPSEEREHSSPKSS